MLSFFSSCRNWDSPNPSPAGECAPPSFGSFGHTRWRERGWESPNSNEATYTVVLFIYIYFVFGIHLNTKYKTIKILYTKTVKDDPAFISAAIYYQIFHPLLTTCIIPFLCLAAMNFRYSSGPLRLNMMLDLQSWAPVYSCTHC